MSIWWKTDINIESLSEYFDFSPTKKVEKVAYKINRAKRNTEKDTICRENQLMRLSSGMGEKSHDVKIPIPRLKILEKILKLYLYPSLPDSIICVGARWRQIGAFRPFGRDCTRLRDRRRSCIVFKRSCRGFSIIY